MAPRDGEMDGGGGGGNDDAGDTHGGAGAGDEELLLLRGVTTLGLTGSIGMGKSTVSAMIAALSVPVLDADAVVHALYAPGGAAVAPVVAAFSGGGGEKDGGAGGGSSSGGGSAGGVLSAEGGICRVSLSRRVLGDDAAMRALERIVHPLVAAERRAFLLRCARRGAALAALDVPLLFETGGDADVDAVAVASAPAEAQRARVLARPGMTAERLESVLARQTPDAEKRARADFVVDTGAALEETETAVRLMVAMLRAGEAAGAAAEAGALLVARPWRLDEARARRRQRRQE